METSIVFQEKQTKIYIGKHKVTKSTYGEEFIELHLVCSPEEESGYNSTAKKGEQTIVVENKFVKILIFKNIHSMEVLKQEIETGLENIQYFEGGGYLYVKKEF